MPSRPAHPVRTRQTGASRDDSSRHVFEIGLAVQLKGNFAAVAEIYHITALLPPVGNSPQYRIRSDEERYERVATQDQLEPISPT